jgi:hypothetical protein
LLPAGLAGMVRVTSLRQRDVYMGGILHIAYKLLVNDRPKYLALLVAITFAVFLIIEMTSLFAGILMRASATVINIGASIWVMDPSIQTMASPSVVAACYRSIGDDTLRSASTDPTEAPVGSAIGQLHPLTLNLRWSWKHADDDPRRQLDSEHWTLPVIRVSDFAYCLAPVPALRPCRPPFWDTLERLATAAPEAAPAPVFSRSGCDPGLALPSSA